MADPVPTLTRRGFIRGASALTFALALGPRRGLAAAGGAPPVLSPNALLSIDTDGAVRITMPHADLGCGIYTGLAQVLADELDADWNDVVTEHLETLDDAFRHPAWGVIATGASTSVASQWDNLRQTGATARAMLVAAAAVRWGVDAGTLRTERSTVIDDAGRRHARYAELTAAAAALEPPTEVALKRAQDYRLIGRSLPRLDGPEKASGAAVFGIDVTLPGMLHAAIAHAPVFGARLRDYDASAAEGLPGVRKVVVIPTGVAVIAESYWQAKKARDALRITWDDGDFARVSSDDLWRRYRELAETRGPLFEQRGVLDFDAAAGVIEGELRFPFLAHAPMEPLNATARVGGDRCELWAGTQFQGLDAPAVAKALGIDVAGVTIHTQWLGGSFGRRASPHGDFLVEAAQVAQASGLGNPIKLLWQREDDIQGGLYRPMALHRYRVGVDDEGLPAHWDHRVVCASITKTTPLAAAFDVDGFDLLSIEGLRHNAYACPNVEYMLHSPEHAVSVCWWRGEADSHTGPAVESIMNRLARRARRDPFDYRRALLGNTPAAARIVGVLDALETAADWRRTPAPGVYRGMAVHPSFGSVCGYVVELIADDADLRFQRVVCAFDCGRVINPAAVRSQVYSTVAFALSTFLGQQITLAGGRAVQSNLHDYVIARAAQVPDVEVHLVDSTLDHPTGVGEVGVAPFIPALMEAIFAATGQEVESFPLALEGYTLVGA